jgi:hypothetical protein
VRCLSNIDIFRSLQSLRRQFRRPRKNEGNRKSEDQEQNDEPHCPIGDFEERKNLTRHLHEQPCDDCIGDRNYNAHFAVMNKALQSDLRLAKRMARLGTETALELIFPRKWH